jgi:hypothetical protein
MSLSSFTKRAAVLLASLASAAFFGGILGHIWPP